MQHIKILIGAALCMMVGACASSGPKQLTVRPLFSPPSDPPLGLLQAECNFTAQTADFSKGSGIFRVSLDLKRAALPIEKLPAETGQHFDFQGSAGVRMPMFSAIEFQPSCGGTTAQIEIHRKRADGLRPVDIAYENLQRDGVLKAITKTVLVREREPAQVAQIGDVTMTLTLQTLISD